MAESTLLTCDLGTSALKAVLWSADGLMLARAEVACRTARPAPKRAEQDACTWWSAVCSACDQLREARGERTWRSIAAIGLSSQRETVVPCDRNGTPIRPAILWLDRRSEQEAGELANAAGGAHALQQRTGLIADASFTATKLLWLRRHDPEALRAHVFLQARDYLYFRLTGHFVTDRSLASRTLLWDLRGESFDEELCAFAGVRRDQFPSVEPSASAPFAISREASRALELTQGVPVSVGGGDRPCEALGTAATARRAMESSGTTTNLSIVLPELPPNFHSRLVYTAHVLPGELLVEQGMSSSGAVLDWFRDLSGADRAVLEQSAAAIPPGADGLMALPLFMGARATRWQTAARGALVGLTLGHTRGHVARALLEAISFELRACVALLAENHSSPDELVLVGGGNRSRLWSQIKSDVLARRLARLRCADAASLGAMLLAGKAIGLIDEQAAVRLNPVEEVFAPGEDSTVYAELAELYELLYAQLKPFFEAGSAAAQTPKPRQTAVLPVGSNSKEAA